MKIRNNKKITKILLRFWIFLFSKRKYGWILNYLFYNSIKYFYRISKNKYHFKSPKKILFIYSKNHFNPKLDNPKRDLSSNSAANLARNIYKILEEKGLEIVYVDQNEYFKNLGHFDLIISVLCKSFIKYANDNPDSKKILFLVNAHPLYRLKILLRESFKFHKKLPFHEYISPIIFFKSLKKTNKLILIGNDFVKNTYIKNGVKESDINLINSGVNSDILIPKKEYLSKNKIKIVFLASDLGIRKGFFRMIDIWEQLNKKNYNIELTILGHISDFKKELGDFVLKYSNVKYCGWIDSSSSVYKTILQSNHMVINLSVEEGQVGCVLEAMSCGCIPVITEESGIPLNDRQNGIIIKAGQFNTDTVVKIIAKLIENKNQMEYLSLNARNYIVNNHSWNKFKTNFIKLL